MEPSPFPRVRNRGTPFLPVGLEISVAGPERIGGEVADWARVELGISARPDGRDFLNNCLAGLCWTEKREKREKEDKYSGRKERKIKF